MYVYNHTFTAACQDFLRQSTIATQFKHTIQWSIIYKSPFEELEGEACSEKAPGYLSSCPPPRHLTPHNTHTHTHTHTGDAEECFT